MYIDKQNARGNKRLLISSKYNFYKQKSESYVLIATSLKSIQKIIRCRLTSLFINKMNNRMTLRGGRINNIEV